MVAMLRSHIQNQSDCEINLQGNERSIVLPHLTSNNHKTHSLRLNGFKTAVDEQLADYGGEGLIESLDRTWAEVKPFYTKLHAVVRWKLNKIYGDKLVDLKSPLPAHLMVSRHLVEVSICKI